MSDLRRAQTLIDCFLPNREETETVRGYDMDMTAEEKQLRLENKKLAREIKRLKKDNEVLRLANEQALRTQAYIQRGSDWQLFYIRQVLRVSANIMIMTDDQMCTALVTDTFFKYNDRFDREAIRRGVPLQEALSGMMAERELNGLLEKCRAVMEGGEDQKYFLYGGLKCDQKDWKISIHGMDMNGSIVGLAIIFMDMTEIVSALERAETADRAKSNFLAKMSHEIRTPINAILGLNEVILRESGERETVSYAEDIQTAGKTLLALINDILDFTKVEEGKMEILPTQYELGSVINDLVNMIRSRAEEKGLNFHVFVDETTPHVLFGDEIRIRQCALNLLTNAVKYTEKGSVTLTVGYEELSTEKILLKFCVADTGIGLKQADMDRLCSPFARLEESRNRTIEGTGLGLSITKQLLSLMGGSLKVDSIYGEGSEFSFAIEQPVVKWWPIGEFTGRFRTDEAPAAARRESFHAPDARVLVVDDVPVNLTVVRGLLKKTQVAVDTATSGAEAIKMAAARRYDAIFIDHMMPGMDGIETLREMKKFPWGSDTVFIALTANAISGSRKRYIDAGFSDYLSKPVDGEKLEETLLKYLPQGKIHALSNAASSAAPTQTVVYVVSGDEALCRLVTGILSKSFRVECCMAGEGAAARAEALHPDLILLDVRVGEMSGFEVLQALRRCAATHETPVVFMTDEENTEIEDLGFRNGASDFIRKAYLSDALMRRARRIIELSRTQSELQNEVKRQIKLTEQMGKEMMLTLSRAVDAKDRFSNDHSRRVAAYSAEIARRMGKSAWEQKQIYEMGLMHNIGMIGVSEDVLNEASELSEEDMSKIRRHTVLGSEVLRSITGMPELADGARSHHERFDGTGYPDGLRGMDIPEAARIICVADCYDAMTSTRVYSSPMPQEAARAEIERCSGTQFDPEIAKIMLQMIDEDTEHVMNEKDADIHVWKESERLWTENAQTKHELPKEAESGALPAWLYQIEELDVATGLKHCGTEETYLETLRIYARTAETGAEEIERYRLAEDLANVTTKVHGLKSTSRVIGATGLGSLAERLEAAGRAGDTKTIDAGLGVLLARYRALGERLIPLCIHDEEEDDRPLISYEKLREAYDSIREVLESMDYESVAFVIEALDAYRIPEAERERCERLRQAADDFDWDLVGEILK